MVTHSNAVRDVSKEPMVVALYNALKEVVATGDSIDASIAVALGNNGSHKHHQVFSPAMNDAAGTSRQHFEAQAGVYRRLTHLAQSKGLFDGIPSDPHRSRGG